MANVLKATLKQPRLKCKLLQLLCRLNPLDKSIAYRWIHEYHAYPALATALVTLGRFLNTDPAKTHLY